MIWYTDDAESNIFSMQKLGNGVLLTLTSKEIGEIKSFTFDVTESPRCCELLVNLSTAIREELVNKGEL